MDDSTASDVTPPLPIPAGRAPVVYENTPDPWSRSIDPVGPGFVRQPTLVNNVWKPPPGGYTTEDNPRFHEGTPAFQADLAAHTLQGYRPLENKAMPGTPLAAALDAYNQGLPELVARRNAGVQTPAGPAAIGIRTLRGRTPGLIAGYTPEQEAAMRQGGIHLVTGPAGEFEWNASNVGLPSKIWEQRRAQALKESQAAANVQLHRAQTEHWEAEARKAERGEDPEAIKQARINQILGKNPALMDPRVNPLFAREAGVLPLTPEQNVLASMNRQQVPETMPTLLEAAEVPIPELMAVPAYRKELEEAARNVAGGLPPKVGVGCAASKTPF